MKGYKKTVGDRIAARRAELGFSTQKELAMALGMKEPSRVGKWEAGMAMPRGRFRDKLLKVLRIEEETLFGLVAAAPEPPQTVADMTPAELEALVARASKRDATINLEIARLKKELAAIHPAILEKWPEASTEMKALCLFFLTGRSEFLGQIPIKTREKLPTLYRILGIEPPKDQT